MRADRGARIATVSSRAKELFEASVDQEFFQCTLILQVAYRFAFGHLVKRWLRNVDVATLYQLGHLSVEERQQKSSDM